MEPAAPLFGLWIDDDGRARLCERTPDGGRAERAEAFAPWCWADAVPPPLAKFDAVELTGDAFYRLRLDFPTVADLRAVANAKPAQRGANFELVRPLENLWLMAGGRRLFAGAPFAAVRRLALDIECHCARPDGFCDPKEPEDRVLAIGLWLAGAPAPELLELEDFTDTAEKALLERFAARLRELDPDVVEGHNLFNFDLDYLRHRGKRFKLKPQWGRFGAEAVFRKSRLRVAERYLDFQRCDLPGRTVFDTYLAVQLYDVSTRDVTSYGLKDVAVYFGITDEDAADRTYLAGHEIQEVFRTDRTRFRAYLADDLREVRGLSDLLLPTYVAQAMNFPSTLQEILLRGSGTKVDLLLCERYHRAGHSLPAEQEVESYEGGFTRSYASGVFREVLHFDVASLYPSLLLHLGRNPAADRLGVFLGLLKEMRTYRLHYKTLAKNAPTADERAEAQARQQSFKILINSFYGYLGFAGARFADGALAAEVTRTGRELLQALIARFGELGCTVLEADTDGLYLTARPWEGGPPAGPFAERAWAEPEALLAAVAGVLPPGIELEFDGRYPSMLCYKAKNYALYDGHKVTIRGSALRSRGIEPYLKHLTSALLRHRLGVPGAEDPAALLAGYRRRLPARAVDVRELAKGEYLSQSPAAYEKALKAGAKSRRASLEVALTLQPPPRMGEKVTYYLTAKAKGCTSEWQRARALSAHDPVEAPYDPDYYLRRLADWEERYADFLGTRPPRLLADDLQGELALDPEET